ncbi:MAG: 16S rRNA (cytosine(967)-C(5))-methyltransferase RsmB [Streptococcaceae bacterium]|nr:16S rRNA (cytosine(967)-C(5))-methyltransferase RsmB [Streptococcaceae bacterium]
MLFNPRRVALEVLDEVLGQEAYANIALDTALTNSNLSEVDRNFVTALVYGTISNKMLLDWYLQPFLKKKTKTWLHSLLILTAYQILFMDKVPTSAAVDEAVKLAKVMGGQQTGNFVNAVLRNFSRADLPEKTPNFSIKYSIPDFLVQKFIGQFGKERAVAIFESLNEPSHASIRIVDPEVLHSVSLRDTLPSEISPVGRYAEHRNFAATQEFNEGKITIQDDSSQLVAIELDAQPDDLVLDACAAPGGKSCQIASYLTGKGRLIAGDLYDHKLRLIEENAKRLHVSDKIQTIKADATKIDRQFPAGTFDKILVDAPCSGLGLMRRKPDIKYRRKATDFTDLQAIQLRILQSCALTLKKNGIIIYSTCTLADEENFDIVKLFLESHSDFEQVNLEHEKSEILRDGCIFITPEQFHTDGFFIAKFKKIS